MCTTQCTIPVDWELCRQQAGELFHEALGITEPTSPASVGLKLKDTITNLTTFAEDLENKGHQDLADRVEATVTLMLELDIRDAVVVKTIHDAHTQLDKALWVLNEDRRSA
jgi:hypothetical protein